MRSRSSVRDWDGLELAAMLLGPSSGAGDSGGGGIAGAELSAGITLGILGCLRDAADQQRLNRGVVMQVTCMHIMGQPVVFPGSKVCSLELSVGML